MWADFAWPALVLKGLLNHAIMKLLYFAHATQGFCLELLDAALVRSSVRKLYCVKLVPSQQDILDSYYGIRSRFDFCWRRKLGNIRRIGTIVNV